MNTYSKTYFPNLDAARFLAFLAVFVEHMVVSNNTDIRNSNLYGFYIDHFHLASLGVGFFIVLSGFLITWIILEEYKFTSSFNLFFFWVRRSLRIWPLYFFIVLAGFILIWEAKQANNVVIHDMPSLIWLITFTLNFYMAKDGQNFLFFIAFLWSISAEEQLYILWGIVLKWLKKLFIPFCFLLLILSLGFRIYAIHQPDNLYFNTLNWTPHFTLGALIAYISINGGRVFERLKNLSRPIIISIYLLFIVNLVLYNQIYASEAMTIIQRFVDALFFAFFIFEQNFCENRLFNLGISSKLNYLGRISYGLFCYHGLIILLFAKLIIPFGWLNNSLFVFIINPVLIFAITLAVSAASYKYFEQPIMSLRDKFKSA